MSSLTDTATGTAVIALVLDGQYEAARSLAAQHPQTGSPRKNQKPAEINNPDEMVGLASV